MKNIALLLLFLIPIIASSQTALETTLSSPYFAIKATQQYYFSDIDKGQSLTVKFVENGVCLLLFDNKSNKHIKKNIITEIPNGFALKNVRQVGKKYYCFLYFWDSKNMVEQFFAQEIDFDNCTFKGEINKIIEINTPVENFTITHSRDSSKLLIHTTKAFKSLAPKDIYDEYFIYVFDENMQTLNSGKIIMPHSQEASTLIDYTINSDNIPFFLFVVPNPNFSDETKKNTPNYALELLRFDLKKSNINITRINHQENKFIQSAKLIEQPDNKTISCVGLYSTVLHADFWATIFSKEHIPTITHGFFILNINSNGDLKDASFVPYEIKNEDNKSNLGLEDITIHQVYFAQDNNIRIILEQYYSVYYESSNGLSSGYKYYHQDIFVAKINKENSLDWMTRLKKDQQGGHTSRCGIAYRMVNNKHFFVFFDNPQNENLQAKDKHELYHTNKDKSGSLVAYTLDDSSISTKKYTLLNDQKIKSDYQITGMVHKSMIPVSDSEIIIELLQKKQTEIMLSIKLK